MSLETIYLGDGAYVTDNDYEVVFTANDHDPAKATDVVSLDGPSAIEALKQFIARYELRRQPKKEPAHYCKCCGMPPHNCLKSHDD